MADWHAMAEYGRDHHAMLLREAEQDRCARHVQDPASSPLARLSAWLNDNNDAQHNAPERPLNREIAPS
ncbi:hypothetical protein HC928_22685 [bacterium]|nr:hypothetical protein [bacterium]